MWNRKYWGYPVVIHLIQIDAKLWKQEKKKKKITFKPK